MINSMKRPMANSLKRPMTSPPNHPLNRIIGIFQKLIPALSLLCFLLIWGGTFSIAKTDFFTGLLPLGHRILLLATAGILMLLGILALFWHIQSSCRKRLLYYTVFLFFLMTVIFLILIHEFRIVPLNDSHSILDQALSMARSGEKPMSTGGIYTNYFSKYSNNYALALLFVGIFRLLDRIGITDMYTPLFLLNMLCLLLGAFFTWLTARRAFGLCIAVKALLLCALNPVYYLMVFWVYSNTLSVPFLMGLIYIGLCIYSVKDFRIKSALAAAGGILCVLGFDLRPTTLIPVIALFAGFLLHIGKRLAGAAVLRRGKLPSGKVRDTAIPLRQTERLRWLGVFAAGIIAAGIAYAAVSAVCSSYFYTVSEGNYPLTHWLMMGSHDEGRYNVADDSFTFSYPAEEKAEATLARTIENYRTLGVRGTLRLMHKKLTVTWSDGYFAMEKRLNQNMRYSRLYAWLVTEKSDLFHLYCQSFWLMVLLLVILSILRQLRSATVRTVPFLLLLSLFGAILFYCFWEVKEAYAIPFLPIFYLLAADGANGLRGIRSRKGAKATPSLRCRVAAGMVGIFALVLCSIVSLALYRDLCNYEITHRDYSILCNANTWLNSIMLSEGDAVIQEFYPNETFNEITLLAQATDADGQNDCRYSVTLTDASGNPLYTAAITAADVASNGTVRLNTGQLPASPEEGYRLLLEKESGAFGDLNLLTRKGICLDTYKGSFTINGALQGTDLYMQISHTFTAPYCRPVSAAVLCFGGWLMAVTILMYYIRSFLPVLKA